MKATQSFTGRSTQSENQHAEQAVHVKAKGRKSELEGYSKSSDHIIKIMLIVAVIEGVFIYHLCFVVLSILHHRDKEQRTEMGRKTKIKTTFSVCSYCKIRLKRLPIQFKIGRFDSLTLSM